MMQDKRTVIVMIFILIILVVLVLVQNNNVSTNGTPILASYVTVEATHDQSANQTGTTDFQNLPLIFDGMDSQHIAAIRFEDPAYGDVITIRRDSTEWKALEFTNAIQTDIANAIATTVARLPYTSTISLSANDDLRQYGLTIDGTLLLISVILDDNEQHSIAIGLRTPDGEGYYVLIDDGDTIYISPISPIAFLLKYPSQMVSS